MLLCFVFLLNDKITIKAALRVLFIVKNAPCTGLAMLGWLLDRAFRMGNCG
jgi:hypothetical protein